MRESIDAKASRLLANGAVHVHSANEDQVIARVRGESGIHDVEWNRGEWSCTCLARGVCSHERAVWLCTMGRPQAVSV
jgi:uncharacterized Zn finger protein